MSDVPMKPDEIMYLEEFIEMDPEKNEHVLTERELIEEAQHEWESNQ